MTEFYVEKQTLSLESTFSITGTLACLNQALTHYVKR